MKQWKRLKPSSQAASAFSGADAAVRPRDDNAFTPLTLLSSPVSAVASFLSAVSHSATTVRPPCVCVCVCRHRVHLLSSSTPRLTFLSFSVCLQGHPEGGCDVSGPPEEDPEQRPDDAGTDEPDPVGGGLTREQMMKGRRKDGRKEGRKDAGLPSV